MCIMHHKCAFFTPKDTFSHMHYLPIRLVGDHFQLSSVVLPVMDK